MRDWSSFISYTSNLWERTIDFRRYTAFLPMLISESSRSPEKLSVGTIQIDSALCCTSHMVILSVVTRIKKGSCPFCDCSYQFVYRPEECKVYQFWPKTIFKDDLWGYFETILQLFPVLPCWNDGVHARSRDFGHLFSRFIRQLSKSFRALLRMTFHTIKTQRL